MTTLNSFRGTAVLCVGHMVGMVDMAALPLWLGALMEHYRLDSPSAGLVVTMFLIGVIIASGALARSFTRLRHRWVAGGGFTVATICMLAMWKLPVAADSFPLLLLFHSLGGLGVGSALSIVHGAIGRTHNPHRLFGIVNVALGLLAIAVFGIMPGMIAKFGGQTVFVGFAIIMATGAAVSLLAFPKVGEEARGLVAGGNPPRREAIPLVARLVVCAVVCLTLNQSMVFAYVERIGVAQQFEADKIQMVLVVMGFINLLPGAAAALLQRRLSPTAVGIAGPILQALFALSLSGASAFSLYAAPAAFYVTLVIFTHTFLFGLLSRIDPSGRSVSATPAMMMTGSAIGPVLGGIVVAQLGYAGLGWAVCLISLVAVSLMSRVHRDLRRASRPEAIATA